MLSVIQHIKKQDALETAHRALGNCGQVFRFAVATGRAERDPSGDLRRALPPTKGEHFAAVTEPAKVAEILRAIYGYEGSLIIGYLASCSFGICSPWRIVPSGIGKYKF